VLHAVVTHLRINLQEARRGFGLFGWHSYTTAFLVVKMLNINGIQSGQNLVCLWDTVQCSLQEPSLTSGKGILGDRLLFVFLEGKEGGL